MCKEALFINLNHLVILQASICIMSETWTFLSKKLCYKNTVFD